MANKKTLKQRVALTLSILFFASLEVRSLFFPDFGSVGYVLLYLVGGMVLAMMGLTYYSNAWVAPKVPPPRGRGCAAIACAMLPIVIAGILEDRIEESVVAVCAVRPRDVLALRWMHQASWLVIFMAMYLPLWKLNSWYWKKKEDEERHSDE